ncbi:MAG: HAD family hydrolase [Polyangiales bacterium]
MLFDMGGTLDGDGAHWFDRFVELFERAGLADLGHERIKDAFYYADDRANRDPDMPRLGFYPMVDRYARWQLERLGLNDPGTYELLYRGFADPADALLRRHRSLLALLHESGLKLGIISNFCGNIQTICDEYGYSDYLSATLDSRHVGVSKPDPAIFGLAIRELGVEAGEAVYVGDSFERDVRAAKAAGLRAVWVSDSSSTSGANGDAVKADHVIASLLDLPAALGVSPAEEVTS